MGVATVDAMPSITLAATFKEEFKVLRGKNMRLQVEDANKEKYEPRFKSTLWKVKSGRDRMCEDHWLEREVWLSVNNSLVYWSLKDHRELIYYLPEDVLKAELKPI